MLEGFPITNVIDQDNAISATVVRAGDRPESLLTSCVPDLELDCLFVDWNSLESEFFW